MLVVLALGGVANITPSGVANLGFVNYNNAVTNNAYGAWSKGVVAGDSSTVNLTLKNGAYDTGVLLLETSNAGSVSAVGGNQNFFSNGSMASFSQAYGAGSLIVGAFAPYIGSSTYTPGTATVNNSFQLLAPETVSNSQTQNGTDFVWSYKIDNNAGSTALRASFPQLSIFSGNQTNVMLVVAPGTPPTPAPIPSVTPTPTATRTPLPSPTPSANLRTTGQLTAVYFPGGPTPTPTPTPTATPTTTPPPTATPTPALMCVAGTTYSAVADDEFTNDSTLSTTSAQYNASTTSGPAFWSTAIANVGANSRTNNGGTDDAYYTDSSLGFGGYSPFTIGSGGPLAITAEPVPTAYATAPALTPGNGDTATRHWLSGVLTRPGTQYGYFEVSVKEPNLQGFWPAPLWLLGAGSYNGFSQPYGLDTPPQPYGLQEDDANELFGNSLGASVVQQTTIYGYPGFYPTMGYPTPAPGVTASPYPGSSSYVRTTVSPDPSTSYHTYGVLWLAGSPGTITHYIDRVPRSVSYVTPEGNVNPMLQLQVFGSSTYASPPANGTPQSMYFNYYRQYQTTGATGCTAPAVLATATPAPTPNPHPSTGVTTVTLAQTPIVSNVTGFGNATAALTTAPATGDELVAILPLNNTLTTPTGWSSLSTDPNFGIYWCVVGTGGCPSQTSYVFGGNGALGTILDLAGANTSIAPTVGLAGNTYSKPVQPSLRILNSGAINFIAYGLYLGSTTGGPSAAINTIPTGQTKNSILSSLNQTVGTSSQSLLLSQITTEAFQAPQPFSASLTFTNTASITTLDGAIISVLPAGVTPGPTPIPYPSPSYPAQAPTAAPTPTTTPAPTPTPLPTPVVLTGEPFYGNFNLTTAAGANGTWLTVGQSGTVASNTGVDKQSGSFALATPYPVGNAAPQPGNANAFVAGMGDNDGTLSFSNGTPDTTNGGTSWHWSMAGTGNGFAVPLPGTSSTTAYNTATIFTSGFCAQTQLVLHASDNTFTDQTDPFAFVDTNPGIGTDYVYNVQYYTNSPSATVTATFTDTNPSECTSQRGAIALRGEAVQFNTAATMPTSAGTPTPFPSPLPFPSPTPTPAPGPQTYNETPEQSDKFVDSFGAVTHWCSAYSGAQGVGGHWYTNTPALQTALLNSGIRHIRDCIVPSGYAGYATEPGIFTSPVPATNPSVSLQGAGIRMDYLSSVNITHSQAAGLQTSLNGMMDTVEGNNEPNDQGNADWLYQALGFQAAIRSWTSTDSTFAGVSALASSITCYPSPSCPVAPFGSLVDFGNSHGYQNSYAPESSGFGGNTPFGVYGSTNYNKNFPSYYSSPKPVQMTEVGYSDLPTGTVTNQTQLDDYAALRYEPRIFFEHAQVGIPRTYIYDFADDNAATGTGVYDHFGILDYNLNPKPSYNAISGIIANLADVGGQTFTTSPLAYTISGNNTNVNHYLLQKQDGSYWLALWLGVSSWDSHCGNTGHVACTSGDIVNTSQNVTISTTPTFTNAYLLSADETGKYTTAPVSSWSTQSGTVTVSDKIEILELKNVTTAANLYLPPAGSIYLGSRDNQGPTDCGPVGASCFVTSTRARESAIGRTFALNNNYFPWNLGSTFPSAMETDDVKAGRYPVIALSCGDTNYNVAHAGSGGTNATQINATIDADAAAIASYGRPVFVRWFWEFNLADSSNGGRTNCYDPNTDGVNSPDNGTVVPVTIGNSSYGSTGVPANYFSPQNFVAAWRYIHDRFIADGVTNVIWVWCPSGSGGTYANAPAPSYYYPGDSYVDWLALDTYDRADTTSANPNGLGTTLNLMYTLVTHSTSQAKPVMVTETGAFSAEQTDFFLGDGVTLNTRGDQVLQNQYPQIKGFEYFDSAYSPTDWHLVSTTAFGTFATTPYMSAPGPSPYPTPTPNNLPTPTPAPVINIAKPYAGLQAPTAAYVGTNAVTPSTFTVSFSVKCETNPNASAYYAFLGTVDINGGTCDGTTNPVSSLGLHAYNYADSAQASPATNDANGTTHYISLSATGTTLTLYDCLYHTTCTTTSVTTSGVVYNGTTFDIGDAGGGIRQASADIWNFTVSNFAKTQVQTQADSDASVADPYPTPAQTVAPTGYPAPRPQFPNAYAITTVIPSVIDPKYIRSYSTAAEQYYDELIQGTAPNEPSSGFQHTDDQPSNDYVTTGTDLFTYTGTGMYIASNTDPIYNFSCFSGAGCYVGWTLPMNNVHVPYGARTQNSGIGGCDCHLFLIEPLHWVPQNVSGKTTWPDVFPYQYELDIIGANNGSGGANNCGNSSSPSCTVFKGNALPAVNTGYIYAQGVFSTATIGWGGGALGNMNDGMFPGPEVSNIDGQNYDGSGTSGDYAEHAFAVSAQEILNGTINHATGGYVYCLQNVNSGGLPGKTFSDSLCDGNFANGDQRSGNGGNINLGWGYGDLVTFDPTKVTDASLLADTALNPVQRIWMNSVLHHGYYPGDTTKPYQGMLGFGPYIWGADPAWKTIRDKYNLKTQSQYGDPAAVNVNMWMPERYYKYLITLDPCIISQKPC